MTGWRRSFAAVSLLLASGWLNACGGTGAAAAVGSIGVKLGQKAADRSLYVRGVTDGFPAAEAGLQKGDEILMIDGVYVKSMSAKDVTKHLHGPIGSTVALTIARGKRILHVEVKRGSMTTAAAAESDEEKEKQLEE
jgi:C-terminal processing protease CtpA/Prc